MLRGARPKRKAPWRQPVRNLPRRVMTAGKGYIILLISCWFGKSVQRSDMCARHELLVVAFVKVLREKQSMILVAKEL